MSYPRQPGRHWSDGPDPDGPTFTNMPGSPDEQMMGREARDDVIDMRQDLAGVWHDPMTAIVHAAARL